MDGRTFKIEFKVDDVKVKLTAELGSCQLPMRDVLHFNVSSIVKLDKTAQAPVDLYANPTYLPDVLAADYDALWTVERQERVIDAARRNGVAIEIASRLRIPHADFLRRAKAAGSAENWER